MTQSFEKYNVSVCRGEGLILPPASYDGSYCFLQIVSGHAMLDIGLSRYEGTAGDIFHFSAELLHSLSSLRGECMIRSFIYPKAAFVPKDSFEEEIFSLFLLEAEEKPALYFAGHPLHKLLTFHMECIVEEWCGKELFYTAKLHASLSEMLISLLRSYGYREEEGSAARQSMMRLRPVLEMIHSDYRKKLTLASLSAMLSLSEDHFGKLFRDVMGKTPVEYIHIIRINRAMRDIVLTEDAMSDIAKRCGFSDISYFYKVFRELCGKTPASLRKLKRAQNTQTL